MIKPRIHIIGLSCFIAVKIYPIAVKHTNTHSSRNNKISKAFIICQNIYRETYEKPSNHNKFKIEVDRPLRYRIVIGNSRINRSAIAIKSILGSNIDVN